MPGIAYNMAMTAGHGKYPPTAVIASQSKVFVGGIPALVDGDSIIPHPHDGKCQASSKVYIGGKAAAKMGDPISCGDMIAMSSSTVFIK